MWRTNRLRLELESFRSVCGLDRRPSEPTSLLRGTEYRIVPHEIVGDRSGM